MVCLVHLVYLLSLFHPNKRDRANNGLLMLAAFFNSLLGFLLDTFNIKPDLNLVADDQSAAIQRLIPDHTEVFAIEFSLRTEAGSGIAPGGPSSLRYSGPPG